MTTNDMITYIIQRLTERSTWLGLIGLVTAAGVTVEEQMAEQLIAAGMAVAGLVGVLTKDRQGKEDKNG